MSGWRRSGTSSARSAQLLVLVDQSSGESSGTGGPLVCRGSDTHSLPSRRWRLVGHHVDVISFCDIQLTIIRDKNTSHLAECQRFFIHSEIAAERLVCRAGWSGSNSGILARACI
jgi:hypothetical protein